MTLLFDASKEKEYDIRTIERNLPKGTMSYDQVKKFTDKLPDDAEYADFINTEELFETIKGKSQLR